MAIPIANYPDYLVYEDGRIWSSKTNKFLKPAYSKAGYASVELFNENGSRRFLVHRLVATAYIPNPNSFPQINHKDENPKNNRMNNLEWCTAKYNMNYGEGAKTRHSKVDYTKLFYKKNAVKNGMKRAIPVAKIKNGQLVESYESAKDASRKTGIPQSCILRVMHGERKTAGGYEWRRMEVLA